MVRPQKTCQEEAPSLQDRMNLITQKIYRAVAAQMTHIAPILLFFGASGSFKGNISKVNFDMTDALFNSHICAKFGFFKFYDGKVTTMMHDILDKRFSDRHCLISIVKAAGCVKKSSHSFPSCHRSASSKMIQFPRRHMWKYFLNHYNISMKPAVFLLTITQVKEKRKKADVFFCYCTYDSDWQTVDIINTFFTCSNWKFSNTKHCWFLK